MKSVIFQAAKLGDIPKILEEFAWAEELLHQKQDIQRIYGLSGGALVALAFTLTLAAEQNPVKWPAASPALNDFRLFLQQAHSRQIRRWNWDLRYGFYNLNPLRNWLEFRLCAYCACSPEQASKLRLTDLTTPLYLCAGNRDGTFTLFGQPDETLQMQYGFIQVGPPQDAPILEALIASLSTLLSTEPIRVNGVWHRDCRPAIVDAGALVADLEKNRPANILRTKPHAPVRQWKQNWFTSSFIMHSQNERNQALLASYYLDLLERYQQLEAAFREATQLVERKPLLGQISPVRSPALGHIDLPYVGSTEATTNMRQSVAQKDVLMERFRRLLDSQAQDFPFEQPTNVIYGAGGFSGILAGLVTTRMVEANFEEHGGCIQQIYGVSAGVLNGFFHAVQVASRRYPDLYLPAARYALNDLENFIATIKPAKLAKINYNPFDFWKGWANLNPLANFLAERLTAYTGSRHPTEITFDEIGLPMTIAAARLDGFTDFLGMTQGDRRYQFGGREWRVLKAPIIQAMLAGWSMNTYIIPTRLRDQTYTDGGGSFYDVGLFVACFDPTLTNLLNIHLDEPEGHSYQLPPRPNLVRIVFDTHNYIFPEERRRMRCLTDLLYRYFNLREAYISVFKDIPEPKRTSLMQPPADFRRDWIPRY